MVDCLLLSNIQSNRQQQIYLAQGSGPPEPGWRLPPASGGDYDRPSVANSPARARTPYPGGGDLPKEYYNVMDPFVALTAAAIATSTLKVGTGVCLLNQRDPVQTAK